MRRVRVLRGMRLLFVGLNGIGFLVGITLVARMWHSRWGSGLALKKTLVGRSMDPTQTMNSSRTSANATPWSEREHEFMAQTNRTSNRTTINNVTILQHFDPSKITANSRTVIEVRQIILGEEHPTRIVLSNNGNILPLQEIQKRGMGKDKPLVEATIDRIYYINLDNRPFRRAIMEAWLSEQSIPYERVAAQRGQPGDTCVEGKTGPRCMGMSGLARTYFHIMDNLNTTGLTLVIEDDFVIRRMQTLLPSVNLIPQDWDMLRWDCWDKPLPYFEHYPFSFKINPIDRQSCKAKGVEKCWFCGGNHVALWRGGESLQKLKKIWAGLPIDDVDCLLHHHPLSSTINTYCLQIGIGEFHSPLDEISDVSQASGGRR
jgi:hypothetical protein